jgi:hypothetical protein
MVYQYFKRMSIYYITKFKGGFMKELIKKFFKDMLSEKDGKSYCVIRVSFLFALVSFVFYAFYSVFTSRSFDLIGFGTGASALLGSGGAGVGLKSKLGGDAPIEQSQEDTNA